MSKKKTKKVSKVKISKPKTKVKPEAKAIKTPPRKKKVSPKPVVKTKVQSKPVAKPETASKPKAVKRPPIALLSPQQSKGLPKRVLGTFAAKINEIITRING
ncbi:hypothetical protein LCGC14_0691490 [marine sediment metagenome]|uniref:Uncharacterized protein n=1 Tax=marine sediment metagenome TaxID=412755 RepID=A0A0F9T6J6_9ZZZZ